MQSELLFDKINTLRPHRFQQVADFVDLLIKQDEFENVEEPESLSRQFRDFIDERSTAMKATPEKNISLEKAVEKLNAQYGWDI